ncbi:cupin domain-containing protein [Pusillimonas noertemannii]|uniref:ChrR-like anti-ECFsigma factor n=1 Tax=Pusillimonas noertemannii TaxID=305977 RepID=A0A2U1CMM6_9BURK|nr:cupin domain-containing protein [Pusillimonas noertemannii]NYT68720.1 cupin domain-containing protein [Pusillimonas noertemannii]PVY62261.1 ChrR-like anti-ECFsigma factor [Pusillimonas noertemannii]TFL10762.1 anti-sigma factor [Pusillimonas noertemannii]
MLINADFSRRVSVTPQQYEWVSSPQRGVERVMLDRVGGEQARATSIVRYAPDSCFPRHQHPRGEELLVLSGTFSEDGTHYPAGWYLRSPPGSGHQPSSREGCIIFVKLQQMQPSEQRIVRIDTQVASAWHRHGDGEICPLFSDETEQVSLRRLVPAEALFVDPAKGAEFLVLAGIVMVDGQRYEGGSWMRVPLGQSPQIAADKTHGATLYLKTGHLAGMPAGG